MTLPAWLDVTLRSIIVYAVLLIGLRLAGKRHSGNLSPHDLVLMLLVSNAVQNAMVGTDVTLLGGIVAATTLIVLNVLITRLVLHHRRWGPLFAGTPTMLVYNGQILHEYLKKEEILPAELEAQIRAHGYEDASAVKLAVQECDGSISVIGFDSHSGQKKNRTSTGTKSVRGNTRVARRECPQHQEPGDQPSPEDSVAGAISGVA